MVFGVNPKLAKFQGHCLVAFIDILGFSKEIKDNWAVLENNPFDRLKQFVNRVNYGISEQIKELKTETNQDTYYKCKVETFSDSVIVTYGFCKTPNKREFLVGLFYMAHTISQIWKTALGCNYTIRGGLEYGKMRWDKKTFAGPAFIEAYTIESKRAISSRVVFSDTLAKCICEYFDQSGDCDDLFCIHLKKIIRPYLYLDCDKSIILSPHSLYKTLFNKDFLIRRLIAMQNKCTTIDTILKYTPLLNILTSKEKKFSDEDIELLKLKIDYATPTT